MFEFYPIEILDTIKENDKDCLIITIDSSIVGKRGIIDHIEKAIQSPYVKDNWDGFDEALGDIWWLTDPHIRILHYELPLLSSKDLSIYIHCLYNAFPFWEMQGYYDIKVFFVENLKERVENSLVDYTVMMRKRATFSLPKDKTQK